MSKILFISNLSNRITSFVTASIAAAHELGMEFYQAANWEGAVPEQIGADERAYDIKIKSFPISRNPLARSNFKAYKELVAFIRQEKIDYIHCNTPTGGILGRLAGKKCKVKKVIYEAHGFHFYKGAPKKNWLVYYPIEKWLARYTDALITINSEDFALANKKLKPRRGGQVYYVPGVGIDAAQYSQAADSRASKRRELGIPEDAIVLISAGELNQNKNNKVIISALERLERKDIHYVLCGIGDLEGALKQQAQEAGLADRVHFLGYRNDVKELYGMADCFVMPSFREGLSRSIMEAMASGLPCVVSKIRGNIDLIQEEKGGFLCDASDLSLWAQRLQAICEDESLRQSMRDYNKERILAFGSDTVQRELVKIYQKVYEGGKA